MLIGDTFQKAKKWFCIVEEELSDQDFSESSLQCLLGTWICDRATGLTEPTNMKLSRTIASQVETLSDEAILSCDAKLLLLCLSILKAYGLRATRLEQHAKNVAEALSEHASLCRDYVGLSLALHRIGLSGWPIGTAEHGIIYRPMIELLEASMDDVRSLYNAICDITFFGTRKYPELLRHRDTKYAVSVLMTAALRNYDLSSGATLLRAATYLGMSNDPIVKNAIGFFNIQQLTDGRFGQYDLFSTKIKNAGFDPRLQMYLPLAVSCVWSLSECSASNFRLFASPKDR